MRIYPEPSSELEDGELTRLKEWLQGAIIQSDGISDGPVDPEFRRWKEWLRKIMRQNGIDC